MAMFNNRKYYTTHKPHRARVLLIVLLLAIIIAGIAWTVWDVLTPRYEPDIEVPMTNTNVTWAQTWHYGPWGDA